MEKENEETYERSIENTYKYLIEQKSFEDILVENIEEEMYIFLGDVISNEISNEEIDSMISYFESTEEYEKCHQLKILKNE